MKTEVEEPKAEIVRAEFIPSPAMQAQTVVDMATVQALVQQQVAEMLTRSDTAVFEPFFRNRQASYALRRLQTIDEQRVHSVRYARFGCMLCEGSNTPHAGLGMCARCYAREFQLRKRLLQELIEESERR